MNENLLKYFEITLSMHQCKESSKTEDLCIHELDKIYNEMSTYERKLIKVLLTDAERFSSDDMVTRLKKIIDKIKERKIVSNIFDTKEDYINFRTKWKQLYADGEHKPVRYDYTGIHWIGMRNGKRYDKVPGYYMESSLKCIEHLFYCAAIGKDLDEIVSNMTYDTAERIRNDVWYARVHGRSGWPSVIVATWLTNEQNCIVAYRIEHALEKRKKEA